MTISYASELIAPRSSADKGQAAENTLEAGSSGDGRGERTPYPPGHMGWREIRRTQVGAQGNTSDCRPEGWQFESL